MATSQVTVNHEAQWARRTSLLKPQGGPHLLEQGHFPRRAGPSPLCRAVGIRAPLPQGSWLVQVKSWGL